ncbi:LOW QUALITY PROTEIN: taste receptor type 1 member 1-like [Gouania willdenowi]|uniref:LOW QUALITY PROTEIN: taste receptor type 1 member 1-like n=1 Tax=Gouania willdenowi TaxID=441366 RepID=UPI001054B6C5|nr:LOW QUALITY PROTEIN: taste receptor type 1 member 1-like [Gouania willdenowi]
MKPSFASWWLLGIFLHTLITLKASDFNLEGDYLLGGLFGIHYTGVYQRENRPATIDCSSQFFSLSSYRRFQLMRFSIEEINNSTQLLPNVSLGYEIFDHCSETQSFFSILDLISIDGAVRPWAETSSHLSVGPKVIAVVGPYTSGDTVTTAPFFMVDLISVVSYGAASSAFSEKTKYPSFLRTVNSNKAVVEMLVKILEYFNWRWVAFLNSYDDFGIDALELFKNTIKDSEICIGYTKSVTEATDYNEIFKSIKAQKIRVIIVFLIQQLAEVLIEKAVQLNVTNRVWIATDTWSLNKNLRKLKGIQTIGTVLGVAQPVIQIPGFQNFIHSTGSHMICKDAKGNCLCNQAGNYSNLTPEDIISSDPTYSFPVYAAVYAIAHALHNVLQCEGGKCNDSIRVFPYMVLAALKKSNFTLLNQTIHFNENGEPMFGSYLIVFWNRYGEVQEVGAFTFQPKVNFFINSSKIQWHMDGHVPVSLCSQECNVGYAKKQDGIHKCCFTCQICRTGTFINITEDPYTCKACSDTEWSPEGSTRCNLRLVEYVPFTDPAALGLMVIVGLLVVLTLAVCVLFAFHYNTPVVRSAGGPMCFLILGCLSLSSISVFFYFGKPSVAFCIFRFLPFLLFYTVCVSCFVVRSFQIVCIFKIAAKFPKLQSWWVKYHGQWVVISVAFVIQALVLLIGYSSDPPKPYYDTFWYPDKIILNCDINLKATSTSVIFLLTLCILCFIFSYMGKDLPKNYNEAKSITFCLMLLILTWVIFATEYMLYHGRHILTLNALAVLCSLYSFLLWYFLPKCYIIMFQPRKNTQQHFQGLIQSYTKTISQ